MQKRRGGFCRALFLAGAVLPWLLFPAEASEDPVVKQGVYLGGIDIGRMTAQQVEEAVTGRLAALGQTTLTVTVGEQEKTTTVSRMGIGWSNREILGEILELGTHGNIVQRYKDEKDLAYNRRDYELELGYSDDAAWEFAGTLEEFNTEPENAVIYTTGDLTPGVEGGTKGITVRQEETAARIREALASWDEVSPISVEAAVDYVDPEVSYEELSLICDDLGHATTYYGGSDWGRVMNVENGCSKISGTLLYPGERFSVTEALVPFTPENGYELAGAYEENQVVQAYGGGICQVSTTLYNAVLKAELEVTDRSNHTMVVGYVDLSKDAAIAEGLMDMSFVNTNDDPVYIIGYCDGANITFWIYGHETRPENRSLELVSVTTGVTEPNGERLVADTDQPVGYINQTQSPHTGYTAELWKNIYVDGELVDSVQVNSSSYVAVGTIYDVGVASTNAYLSQAMYTAIASGNISQVYAVMNNAAGYMQPESETEEKQKDSEASDSQDASSGGAEESSGQDGGWDASQTDPYSGMSQSDLDAEIAADLYGETYGY